MSRGKYSPNLPKGKEYAFNCYGQIPAPYNGNREEWDEKTMFADYDNEGFDRYGYSSFDSDGNYCFGAGIDRNGYTEYEYMTMDDDMFFSLCHQ